ncbi:MAG TPA: ATP-binding protein [Pyrinomonadaceae bacterium]|nr:ATP-binding protein [Pyrinomonadaceae bacterium]
MKGSVLTTKTWFLLIGAALLITAGVLNFAQRARHETPAWDGVEWVDTANGVIARTIEKGSAADRAWLLPGDRLVGIALDPDGKPDEIARARDVQIYLDAAHVGGQLHYRMQRPSYPVETQNYWADLDNLGSIHKWTPRVIYINFIGLAYLLIGFFVLFKQGGRAPFVLHFATLCLAAFVFHFYTETGTFRDLDLAISFLKNAAFIIFAPLFLHFCALYPTKQQLFTKKRWRAIYLYIPALVLLAMAAIVHLPLGAFAYVSSVLGAFGFKAGGVSEAFVDAFYRLSFFHFVIGLVASVALLFRTYFIAKSALVRQQMKWVVWGTVLAVAPFILLYGVVYLFGASTDRWLTDIAVLPLIVLPFAFGYSVLRYRLMDVELVVRRVFVYALTTLAITLLIGLAVYMGGLYAFGSDQSFSSGEITLRVVAAVVAMAVIVMVAAPVKHFLQEQVDRLFYGERYDLRNSLLDFGRTISATTALDPLLDSLVSRLQEVMNVGRVAIFVEDKHAPHGYVVARSIGLDTPIMVPPDFREMIRVRSAESGVVRADDLDLASESVISTRRTLHYFVPCVVRGRMVAVIGLGRSVDGALLSSEDVEILRTVSGYVAVAIENSLLYKDQQERASELKHLKEFNESIIESINVGLLAVDLDGCVTRLNSALEHMLDLRRDAAIGRRVEDLFSEDFADTLKQVLGKDGWRLREVRNIYKLHTATRTNRALILNIALAPLQDAPGQSGALVVIEDVTTRISLEEQLQQREKLSSIGLLAAGVAHEVNTPLTGVSSYTQMLLGMLNENDPKRALLQKVRTQAERASDIVNNLLNFSRTGSAEQFGDVNVARVLDDTLQLLEPQLRRSQIEIVKSYDGDAPEVYGNAGKLQQVFTNLLLNARDAIPDGGKILVATTTADDGSLVAEISDTGIGIAPENVAKIYDPFYTTKGVGQGTGLGLAVTYGIVQEHAGRISVDSTPSHGTTFRITLPAARSRVRLQAVGD